MKLNNQNNPLLSQRVDNLGLTLIGLISLGYCCFRDSFAELNIQLPFFNFPIFIGEISLFACLLLLFFKWKVCGQKLTVWGCVALVYITFILYKAIVGYLEWGPLALRHAAIFYYPLFAALGYFFFNKEYFSGKKAFLLIVLFIFILVSDMKFLYIVQWDRIVGFFFLLILIRQHPSKKMRYFLFVIFLICTPYRLFFLGQRTMLVSNIVSMLFLLVALPFVVKIKKKVAIGFVLLILVFLYLGITKFSDKASLHSILNLQDNIKEYKKYTANMAMLESSFIIKPIKQLRVYNRRRVVIDEHEKKDSSKIGLQLQIEQQLSELEHQVAKIGKQLEEQVSEFNNLNKAVSLKKPFAEKIASSQISPSVDVISKEVKLVVAKREFEKNTVDLLARKKELTQQQSALKQQLHQLEEKDFRGQYCPRDLGVVYGNSIFRILIWQDMIMDLKVKKPILGFAFGKPFRSKKIEVLNMADGEWKRDGWIAAHNSYLEIIYRLGIIGLFLIALLFIIFSRMVYRSIINKSLVGILLCSVLLNWLTAANFMLILELPYHAIPLWSLFGMSLAYLKGFSRK